jgi:hypothetical protein
MTFTDQNIHDLAAELFWRYADDIGVQQANVDVIETNGHCLLEHPVARAVFSDSGYLALTPEEQHRVLNGTKHEAFKHCAEERNIIGTIYADEAGLGRTPGCTGLDTSALNHIPTVHEARPVEAAGTLYLRHPLPAIVYSDRLPNHGFIRVANTTQALGFDLPLYLALTGAQELAKDSYALIGIFYIPIPSIEHGNLWSHVIQNSIRAIHRIHIKSPDGAIDISISWATKKTGILSRLFRG